jgi:DNA polymerase elongation subunit (family B)
VKNLGVDEFGNNIKLEKIDGAYVLETKPGMYDNMASIDMTSLYPKTIESNNISPEKIIGQFLETKSDFKNIKERSNDLISFQFDENHKEYPNKIIELPANKYPELFIDSNWSISGYGTVFDLNEPGILPKLLADWFVIRANKKAEGFKAFHDAEKILEKYS